MSYAVIISRQAKRKLESLARVDRHRIAEKIMLLGANPDNPVLDIKRMKGTIFYRLRVGDWRIVFDRNDDLEIISIEKINNRGDIYK